MKKLIWTGIIAAVAGAIGWYLNSCLLDQRNSVSATREEWMKIRPSTQKYFDDQGAFYDRISMFLDKVHGSRPSADSVEVDKLQLITTISNLDQECNDVRKNRYEFEHKWNHMESVFMVPQSTWEDISKQCTRWPRFAEELRSTESLRVATDVNYEAELYSNKKQIVQAKKILQKERDGERDQAERTEALLREVDGRAIAGNCWTCTKIVLRLK